MASIKKLSLRGKIILLVVPVFGLSLLNIAALRDAARSLDSYQLETQLQKVKYFARVLGDNEAVLEALREPPVLMKRARGENDDRLHLLIEVPSGLAGRPLDAVRIDYFDRDRQARAVRLLPEATETESALLVPETLSESDTQPITEAVWSGVTRVADGRVIVELEGELARVEAAEQLRVTLVSGEDRLAAKFGGEQAFGMPIQSMTNLDSVLNDLGSNEVGYWLSDRYGHIRASNQIATTADITPAAQPSANASFLRRLSDRLGLALQSQILAWTSASDILQQRDSGRALMELALSGATEAHSVARSDKVRAVNASYPIVNSGQVIGALLICDDANSAFGTDILLDILAPVALSLIVTLGAVLVMLWLVIKGVVRRLERLGHETDLPSARYGSMRESYLQQETSTGDEIGALVHNISDILSLLQQHNQFLERMPRTLRHEINNPLNIVSTSLQNLAVEVPDAGTSKYMDSAKRGVDRIGTIVQYLADAVSLEESLQSADREVIDIGSLIKLYIANCKQTHQDVTFECHVPRHPIYVEASDYRIEQLLDKLIDNALDFQTKDTSITIQLTTLRDQAQIIVKNYGPTLPKHLEQNLFASMVTERPETQTNKLHFGLGLYVVRVIADYHDGDVRVANLENDSGVSVTVSLPRLLVYKGAPKGKITSSAAVIPSLLVEWAERNVRRGEDASQPVEVETATERKGA